MNAIYTELVERMRGEAQDSDRMAQRALAAWSRAKRQSNPTCRAFVTTASRWPVSRTRPRPFDCAQDAALAAADCAVVVVTDHSCYDWASIKQQVGRRVA
jgi:hypothetical protein